MSFRRTTNRTTDWRTFCRVNAVYVDALPRLSRILSSSERFDSFLQAGLDDDAAGLITLSSLTTDEWVALSLFVDRYSVDWQSYFVRTMYGGYYRERDRRHWCPTSIAFDRKDLSSQRLVIHFWAKWNTHDRVMDERLQQPMARFSDRVTFRSLDIDRTDLRDICTEAGVLNVPSLALYTAGVLSQTFVGSLEPDAITEAIAMWIDDEKA